MHKFQQVYFLEFLLGKFSPPLNSCGFIPMDREVSAATTTSLLVFSVQLYTCSLSGQPENLLGCDLFMTDIAIQSRLLSICSNSASEITNGRSHCNLGGKRLGRQILHDSALGFMICSSFSIL